MTKRDFWSGFATGAGVLLGGAFIYGLTGRGARGQIIRLEKSVQIARPVQDVFAVWSDVESLPRYTSLLRSVIRDGDRSHWIAEVAGRPIEWDAEVIQVIPNQAIGWKSVAGSKHTGRINFSSLAGDTFVHVVMNYVPRPRILRPVVAGVTRQLESYVEQALRDVKAALESGRGAKVAGREPTQATGTYGLKNDNPRFGTPTNPVEFTRPPEAKS